MDESGSFDPALQEMDKSDNTLPPEKLENALAEKLEFAQEEAKEQKSAFEEESPTRNSIHYASFAEIDEDQIKNDVEQYMLMNPALANFQATEMTCSARFPNLPEGFTEAAALKPPGELVAEEQPILS